ncbi:MAG TPA: lipase maturation factor family protein [Chloroflexota bacterium]|jgi:hypothetical protein
MAIESLVPPPLVVWGIFPRLLGVIYLIAFASLYRQVLPLAGSRGISPVGLLLARIRRDLPLHRRLLHFPSVLWISSSDRALQTIVLLGCAGAMLSIVGGSAGYVGLIVCWIFYLSLDVALQFIYPWDCLLLEAGLLALMLPVVEPLPGWAATALPMPIVVVAFQVLLVRVLWGFGKLKFVGMSRHDFGYLKEFLIFQPMPNRLGWWAHHLPLGVLKSALLLLFLVEVPLPALAFVPGPARLVLMLGAAVLMLGIQFTGNFGFFNVLVLVLLIPLLDLNSSVAQLSVAAAFSNWQSLVFHVVVAVWLVGGVLFFPFNSWAPHSWLYWPIHLNIRPRIVRGLFAFYRSLSGLRVLHGYGVFAPEPLPAIKLVPVLEGSRDGRTWHEYEYRFMPCTEQSPPRAFAPYHPRLDHAIVYEGFGLNPGGFMSSVNGSYNPYHFSPVSPLRRVMQRLMEPESPVQALFRKDPFAGQAPPRFMRATLVALEPTSVAEQRRTGRWWRRHALGVHLVAARADVSVFDRWFNGPELFHWDDVIWRRRVGWLRRYETQARDVVRLASMETLIAHELNVPAETLERFWTSFIPSVRPTCADDWCELESRARNARERFGASLMHDFERIAALLAIGMAAHYENRVFGHPSDALPLPAYFQVGMLMHRLILAGRERFEQALRDSRVVESEARQLTPALGAWLWGVFRFEIMAAHCRAFNVAHSMLNLEWQPGTPAFALLGSFLADQCLEEAPLRRLALTRESDTGLWTVCVEPVAQSKEQEALAA